MKLISFLIIIFLTTLSYAESSRIASACRVIDQSGTQDMPDCGSWDTPIRCYADIEYSEGYQARVWGNCTSSYSQCWWNGSDRVEPHCNE